MGAQSFGKDKNEEKVEDENNDITGNSGKNEEIGTTFLGEVEE